MPTNESKKLEAKAELMRSALQIGSTLHSPTYDYKIVEVLGVGGFGITYKVKSEIMVGNIPTQMFFAIKEHFLKGCDRASDKKTVTIANSIRKDYEGSLGDFKKEAECLNRLRDLSPNIVRVNEHFAANNTEYYVMEYLDGDNLYKIVKGGNGRRGTGAMSEAKALSIIKPIAKAVELVHTERYLHLDIKPANIVMKTDPRTGMETPVLIDFGLAKHFDKKGNPTTLLNAHGFSEGYAPVDQYGEIKHFAPEIDVYALGATLYFLLVGNNPPAAFNIKNSEDVMKNLPLGISSRTRSVLIGSMQPSNFLRTKDAKTFLASLEESSALPIGYILHGKKNYQVIEVVEQKDDFIHYRAVSVVTQINYSGGTPFNRKRYDVFEWFVNGKDKRDSDGVRLKNQAWRSKYSNSTRVLMPVESRWINFVKDYSKGIADKENVRANGTSYLICERQAKQPLTKIAVKRIEAVVQNVAEVIVNYKKAVAIVVGLILLVGAGYEVLQWNKNRPQPTNEELLKKAIADNDTTTLLQLVNENHYTSAIAPLANIYWQLKDTVNAKKYAEMNPSDSISEGILASLEKSSDVQQIDRKEQNKEIDNRTTEVKSNHGQEQTTEDLSSTIATTVVHTPTKAEQLQQALAKPDWDKVKELADNGYTSAYIPLAKHYKNNSSTHNLADKYAQKAWNAGVDKVQAKEIMKELALEGYYIKLPAAINADY